MSRSGDKSQSKSAWRRATRQKNQPYGIAAVRNFREKSNAKRAK